MASKYCTQCGGALGADSKFCSSCGARVKSESAPDATTPSLGSSLADPPKDVSTGRRILKWTGIGCGGILVLLVILIIISIAAGAGTDTGSSPRPSNTTPTPSYAEMVSRAVDVTYDNLFRSNDKYVGEIVHFRGEVVQVSESRNDRYALRVNVTEGRFSWSDTMYVNYSGPRVLENDLIEMVGVVEGLKTYEAIFGNTVTIPEITAAYINVIAKAGER